MPPGATDCHMHVFDHRYPLVPTAVLFPGEHTLTQYREVQSQLGLERHVLVQPSSYGTDNRLLLAALREAGQHARGVAVVHPDIEDLGALHEAGVRGIRVNLVQAGATTLDMVRPLADRITPLGWHLQVHAPAEVLLAAEPVWAELPCPVVFDHLARVPQPEGTGAPVFGMVRELVADGKAWVKLSGFYLDSRDPAYADAVQVAAAYVEANPDRVIWGSDWPHVTEPAPPDDPKLLGLLSIVTRDPVTRDRVLVDNAAVLYGFEHPG